MSKLDGGAYDINYIPELTALAEENLNFSHTDQVERSIRSRRRNTLDCSHPCLHRHQDFRY